MAEWPPLEANTGTPYVVVPQSTSSTGFQSAADERFTWYQGLSTCNYSLVQCTSPGVPAGCAGNALGPALPNDACNAAYTGGYSNAQGPAAFLAVQNCPSGAGQPFCSNAANGGNDVVGNAAVGFNLQMPPFDGYVSTFNVTLTPEFTYQWYTAIQNSWPSSDESNGSARMYVYDMQTGVAVSTPVSSTFSDSASGISSNTVVDASNGPKQLATPLTATFVATAGHAYQVWFWASVDTNMATSWNSNGPDWDGAAEMDVLLNGTTWSVAGIEAAASVPTVAAMTPWSGSAGTQVTLTGTGFLPAYPPSVSFGGIPGINPSCSSSTVCTVTVPDITGAVAATANFGGNTLSLGEFVYVPPQGPTCSTSSTGCAQVTFTCNTETYVDDVYELQNADGSWASPVQMTGSTTLDPKGAETQVVRFCFTNNDSFVCGQPMTYTVSTAGLVTSCNGACGTVPDGCGGTLSCGTCQPPTSCGGRRPPGIKCSAGWHCCGGDGWSCGVCD
jgi:hypothetical protein